MNRKILIALGNPGSRYLHTRHNAGWLWADHHFGSNGYEFNKYGNYECKHALVDGVEYVLIKPQTFMNESGSATAYAMRQFGVTESDVIVVHDEVDLEVGQYKYSCGRGDGGHNGVKSINKHLGNNAYCRLRLGVRPVEIPPSVKADTYVLNRFRAEELKKLNQITTNVLLNI